MTDIVKIASVSLRHELEAYDKFSSMEARLGRFTVKETYKLVAEWSKENQWEGWKLVRKMKIQQRVKVFIWIMVHGKFVTNKEWLRRRLTYSPVCARCLQEDEGVMHAIRDYKHAREV